MPTPIIQIDSATGSDTAASGAGPGDGTTSGTAHSGSNGRTRSAASQLRFGLFGYTTSISDVLTNGSHVIYMNTSTAGQRKFSSIAGTKNTRQTVTGAITSGTAVLTVTDSTGMSVGDVIKVVGAGAAGVDLFSTILTVDTGTQVTLNDNASTTVGPTATVENPRQVTLTSGEGVNQGTADCTWAIGGKRAALLSSSSANLLDNNSSSGDAMSGWIMEMASGHTETRSSGVTIRRSSVQLCIRGVENAATPPILTFSHNGTAFSSVGSPTCLFRGFELRNTNATKTASTAFDGSACSWRVENIKCDHSTDKFWRFYSISSTSPSVVFDRCRVGNLAESFIYDNAQAFQGITISILNCEIFSCGATAVNLAFGQNSTMVLTVRGTIIRNTTGRGIRCNEPSNAISLSLTIEDSTLDNNSSHGIEIVGACPSYAVTIRNCLITNNGANGINTAATAAKQRFWTIDKNNTYNNTSGAYSGLATDAFRTLGGNDPGIDPSYVSSTDKTPQAAGVKGVAWPTTMGPSGTANYKDIGAIQAQASGGGLLTNQGLRGGFL